MQYLRALRREHLPPGSHYPQLETGGGTVTSHPNRCRHCKYASGDRGAHWCYANPPANGRYRQWISGDTYNEFIAILGCASFEKDEESSP